MGPSIRSAAPARQPHPSRLLVVAAAGLMAAAAVLAVAPEPVAEPFRARVDVALVEVEVWAENDRGLPVAGLSREDFEVLEDGVPVPITHFREVGGALPGPPIEEKPPAADVRSDSSEPAHLVVYFDGRQLEPGGFRLAAEGVTRIVEGGTVASERILLLRHDGNLHVEAPFGSSREALQTALDALGQRSPSAVSPAADLEQTKQAVQDLWEQSSNLASAAAQGLAQAAGGGGTPRDALQSGRADFGIDASGCELFSQRVGPLVQAWARDRAQRAATSLQSLSQVASLLAGLPGAKSLLYVSDGLDVEPGAALASYVADFCPTSGRGHQLETFGERLSEEIRSLARHFATHRVTVHAIEGSGLRTASGGTASARSGAGPPAGRLDGLQRRSNREGLSVLADETGGRTVFDRNELEEDLLAIADDLGSYYSLAYEPPSADGRREHQIVVRARDPDLRLRYRRGYREQDPGEAIAEGLLGALHLGVTTNPLGLRIGMGSATEDGRARLYVMVPASSLVTDPMAGEATIELGLRGLIRAPTGESIDPVEQEYRVRIPPGAEERRIDLPLVLRLEPGPYVAAFAVRNRENGETSFVTTAFEVPAP